MNTGNDENLFGVESGQETNDPILSKHLDMAIEAQDGKQSNEEGNEEAVEGDTSAQATQENNKAGGDKSQTNRSDSNSNNTDGNAQQQTDKAGKKDKGKGSNPGDLTLPDGQVIRAGAERRFYESMNTAKQERDHYKTQLATATQQLQTFQQNFTNLQQQVQSAYAMEPDKLVSATKLYSDMRTDPVGTMTKLLAELGAAGYNVATLVPGINTQLTERLGQINRGQLEQQNTTPNTAQLDAQVDAEVTQFYGRYPDARIHDDLIAQGLQQNPQASLVEVYFQLKNAFIEKGFDWNRPLVEQVSNQQQQQQQTPMPPNGRANGNLAPTNRVAVASESADTGDIVREAMREAGLNI